AAVIDVVPLGEEWFEFCAALLLAGKPDDYRDTLSRMLARAGDVKRHDLAFTLARTAALSDQDVVPGSKLADWATLLANFVQARPWYWHVAGLAQWRAGNHEEALGCLDKSAATDWHPELNQIACALIHGSQGATDKARDYLHKVRAWLAGKEAG